MKRAHIYYARTDEFWLRGEKYKYLDEAEHRGHIAWQELEPDANHNWLTEGMQDDFKFLIPISSKEKSPDVIFESLSPGINTARDLVVYDYSTNLLSQRIEKFCNDYNVEVLRYRQKGKPKDIDNFINYGNVKWSEHLKAELKRETFAQFDETKTRRTIYRPFTKIFLYYDPLLIDRPGLFNKIFPTINSHHKNQILCLRAIGNTKPFHCLLVNTFPDFHLTGDTTCLPFYTYDEDGSNRRENITDWALERFRGQYKDKSISKWDIFHYVYAVLHHAGYRKRYAANLKRELPRIPFAPSLKDFRSFVEAGARLAEIHVNYEQQPEYPLERIENPAAALNWRVEKMRLSKDKRSIIYNDFLTLAGVPSEAFEYRLGNRSALEWVIDQYQVTTDRRSGITNDPNRADDPSYILRLLGQVISVSLETVRIVNNLPDLGLDTSVDA